MQSYLSSRFFLLFPFPLIAFQIATMNMTRGTLNYQAVDFISETFFLASTHAFLSLAIFLLPASASWLNQRAEAKRQSIGTWTIVLGILLFSFFMWRALSAGRPSNVRPIIVLLSDFIFTALSLHHTLWQVKGLSMTYELQRPLRSVKPKFQIFETAHTPFYLLLFLVLLRPTATVVNSVYPMLGELVKIRTIGLVASALMLLVTSTIVIPDLFSSESQLRKRGWFKLRLTSWALIPVSKYGFIVSGAIHGVEYLVVTWQLFSKENKEFAIKTVSILLGIAVIFRLCVWGFRGQSPEYAPILLTMLSSVGLAVGVLHFFWDRHLFAMREPETRAFTGKRLLGGFYRESHEKSSIFTNRKISG